MLATLATVLLSALALAPAQHLKADRARPAKLATEPEWTVLKPSNTGIPGDYCQDIFIDDQDRPWVPGYIPFWEEGGVARWDEADDTWFVLSNVDLPQIASPRFNDIEQDDDGVLWIGSDAGLLRYDPSKPAGTMTRYDENNTPMPGSQISGVDIAPDGSIWLAIHNVSSVPPGGLARFDPTTGGMEVWTTASGLPWGGQWPGWDWVDYVGTAVDDDGGYTVYFGSMEMGCASWKAGTFAWFNDPPPSGPHIWGLPSNDASDKVTGSIYLTTNESLVRRDPDGSMTVIGVPVSGSVEAFGDGRLGLRTYFGDIWSYDGAWTSHGNWGGTCYTIAQTSTGDLWAGGIGGAARLKAGASQWQRYRLTNTGMVGYFLDTIDFDDAGNVYMNGNAGPGVGGFTIFDGERWTCVNNSNYGLGPTWGQPSDDVDILCARGNGTLALDVGVGGLQAWNGTEYWPLNSQWITYGLAEDGLGRRWSGNWGRLFLYDDEGGFLTFDSSNSPMFPLPVEDIVPDPVLPGFVYAVTGEGVVHTDGLTWFVYPRALIGLTQFTIGHFMTSVAPAQDGSLWIGTGLGLYRLDVQTLQYEKYTKEFTALPSNEIDHLVVTPDGSVWMTTFDSTWPYPGGLTRFDGTEWTTWTMTDSPLPHNQVWDLTWRPIDGGYEVWIGTASEGVGVVTVRDTAAPHVGVPGIAASP